jgi:hypothetical protein
METHKADDTVLRWAQPDDREALYEVCLRTGDAGNDARHLNRPGFCIRSSVTLEGSGDASKEGIHA